VFYSLFEPLRREPPTLTESERKFPRHVNPEPYNCSSATGKAAMMCHLSKRTATTYNFLESEVARNLTFDTKAWVYGEDVPGKAGWVTCDSTPNDPVQFGRNRLEAEVTCEQGDLVIGYLESYDPRMGVVRVSALPVEGGSATKNHTLIIDAKKTDFHESVFRTAMLQGLTTAGAKASTWRVAIEPVLRSNQTEEVQSIRSQLKKRRLSDLAPGKCTKNKFKLLMLACT
jgi:hypothetical protein